MRDGLGMIQGRSWCAAKEYALLMAVCAIRHGVSHGL